VSARSSCAEYVFAKWVLSERSTSGGPFLATIGEVLWWNAAPNGRRASFYDLWSGHRRTPSAFRARTRTDLGAVVALLADGTLSPQVAARFPLAEVREAMTLAESRTVRGRVVLVP
jgi:NADPH2:quinone reductase